MLASRMANMAAPMRVPEVKSGVLEEPQVHRRHLGGRARARRRATSASTAATAAQPTMSPDENQSCR